MTQEQCGGALHHGLALDDAVVMHVTPPLWAELNRRDLRLRAGTRHRLKQETKPYIRSCACCRVRSALEVACQLIQAATPVLAGLDCALQERRGDTVRRRHTEDDSKAQVAILAARPKHGKGGSTAQRG